MKYDDLIALISATFNCNSITINLSTPISMKFTNIIDIEESLTAKMLWGLHPMKGWCELPEVNTVCALDNNLRLQIHNGIELWTVEDIKSYLFFMNVHNINGHKTYELYQSPWCNIKD